MATPTVEQVYGLAHWGRTAGNSILPQVFVRIRAGFSVKSFGEHPSLDVSGRFFDEADPADPTRGFNIVLRMLHAMKVEDADARVSYRHLTEYGSSPRVVLLKDRLYALDLFRTDIFDFWARVLTVVKNRGLKTIVKEIRTNPDLFVAGAGEIRDWWDDADTQQKLMVLGILPSTIDELSTEALEPVSCVLHALPCPFRWTGRSSAEATASAWGGTPERRDPSVDEHNNEEAGYWSDEGGQPLEAQQ